LLMITYYFLVLAVVRILDALQRRYASD
jgi:hypothetical protein